MKMDILTPFGFKKSIIMDGAELMPKLNGIINDCDVMADRICWELSNQQVFCTKDKEIIAQSIRDFISINSAFHIDNESGVSFLEMEHIKKRFNEIADDILAIDEEKYPHFVFKNTSVDDNVEYWFRGYDEEDEPIKKSLKDWDKVIAEFVFIEEGKIRFATNIDMFKSA